MYRNLAIFYNRFLTIENLKMLMILALFLIVRHNILAIYSQRQKKKKKGCMQLGFLQ
jgi:hypothetical protein